MQRISLGRLRLRLHAVPPAAARELALGIAQQLAAAAPSAAGLEPRVRLVSGTDRAALASQVVTALVRPRSTVGPR